MIEQSVSLASNGVVKVPGYEQLVRFGYTKNRGVNRLRRRRFRRVGRAGHPLLLARPGRQRPGILAGGGRLCGRARQRHRTARQWLHHL